MRLVYRRVRRPWRDPARPAKRTGITARAWVEMIALGALVVTGCDTHLEGPVEEVRLTTAVAMISGDDQRGTVGATLPEALTVRVTDARGEGVGYGGVTWRVASGGGLLSTATRESTPGSAFGTHTGPDGLAAVRFMPLVPGTSTVTAEAGGLRGSIVTFTAAVDEEPRPDWPPVSASALVYERMRYTHGWSTLAHHGRLDERYVLHEDGTFGLQFFSRRFGFFEYPGAYSLVGGKLLLDFASDSRWEATGTRRGDCLTVEYNLIMGLSDFEDGEYCRPSDES